MKEIFNISDNINGTEKADHILEIPGQENFEVERIIHVKSGWRLNVTNNFKDKRRLAFILNLVYIFPAKKAKFSI